jgi:hypothetical protein
MQRRKVCLCVRQWRRPVGGKHGEPLEEGVALAHGDCEVAWHSRVGQQVAPLRTDEHMSVSKL